MAQTRNRGPLGTPAADHNHQPTTATIQTGTTFQPDLLDLIGVKPLPYEQFREFHEDNPQVYDRLVELTREWRRRTGGRRVGFPMLWERVRWDMTIRTTSSPKLNNNMRAYYARAIMAAEPDLAEAYEIRSSPADKAFGGG